MMRSIQQEQLKYELHNELKIKHKEFFESKLAIDMLKDSKDLHSVKKVSAAILKLILSNEQAVIAAIANNPKIIAELRTPYFGSCYEGKQEVTHLDACEKIISILSDENADLKNVLQVHCVFIHRIYDQLEKRSEKVEFVKQLFPSVLFSKESRSRIEKKEEDVRLTTQLGISRHPVFAKMLGQSDKSHSCAMEKYTPDCNAVFFKSAKEKGIPVVCGPSGHIGSLLLGAKLYGNLSRDELKEYTWAGFAFLTAGGNHSFYEVMLVANLVGVDFQLDDYAISAPVSCKRFIQ